MTSDYDSPAEGWEKEDKSSYFLFDLRKFGQDYESVRAAYIIHLTLSVGIMLLVVLGTVALVQKNLILAYTDYILCVLLIAIMINFHVNRSLKYTSYLFISLTAVFFFWLLVYGGVNRTAFVWYFTFPLFSVFILGPARGALAAAFLGGAAFVYFVFSEYFPSFAQYPLDLMLRFIPSYFVVVVFAYLSEDFRDKTQKKLQKANDTLEHRVQERTAELVAKNIALEVASTTDILTGLKNRQKLDEILQYELNRAKRYDSDLCIIMIDIDHFKDVNDTFGHITGDEVLVEFASLLNESIRTTDTIGRWGGEEFLLICPLTTEENSVAMAEKLRKKVETAVFPIVGSLTASFGIACYIPGDNINSIIKRADAALYDAKELRNTCVCYSSC